MKASLTREIRYSDVDAEFRVTLGTLLEVFQDLAALHSDRIGFGIRKLADEGIIWVLSKLGISVFRYPEYGETLHASSWSRGAEGFKMLRDFEIFAGEERIAAGSSVWFFLNVREKRVQRVPREIDLAYQQEPVKAQDPGIVHWAPYQRFAASDMLTVQTRASDRDPSGHVNNTRYGAYVLDALASRYGERYAVSDLRLQFSREIGPEASEVEVGIARDGNAISFRIGKARDYHARGEALLAPDDARGCANATRPTACLQG